jgi:hypothetical protein
LGQSIYAQGIDFAEKWSRKLQQATKAYAVAAKSHKQQAHPSRVAEMSKSYRVRAERHFWNTLDQCVTELFDVVRDVSALNGKTFWEAQVP